MAGSAHDQPLAGLVSDEAAALYARLLAAGELRIGDGPDQVDVDSPAAHELFNANVARRSTLKRDHVIPISEAQALRLLLAAHHSEMIDRQQTIMAGWARLDALLPSGLDARANAPESPESMLEVLTDQDAISKLSGEIYQSARAELRGISLGTTAMGMDDVQLITPPEPLVGRGVRFRMIYDTTFAADPAGSRIILASAAAGEEVRIRGDIPLKMLHVDDRLALVALTPTGLNGAVLVRSPSLLAALRQWFDLLWDHPTSTTVDGGHEGLLSPGQLAVLRHLAAGHGDEAIARAMNSSIRTVRRHVTAILEALDVPTRFAAGAVASKRGWI